MCFSSVTLIRLSICSSSFRSEQSATLLYEGYNEKDLWSQTPWKGKGILWVKCSWGVEGNHWFFFLSALWGHAGKNTAVGCHALLQGLFLIQGSSLCLYLLHWQVAFLPVAPPPGKPSLVFKLVNNQTWDRSFFSFFKSNIWVIFIKITYAHSKSSSIKRYKEHGKKRHPLTPLTLNYD